MNIFCYCGCGMSEYSIDKFNLSAACQHHIGLYQVIELHVKANIVFHFNSTGLQYKIYLQATNITFINTQHELTKYGRLSTTNHLQFKRYYNHEKSWAIMCHLSFKITVLVRSHYYNSQATIPICVEIQILCVPSADRRT